MVTLFPQHIGWLTEWLQQITNDIEDGKIATSICLQGILAEYYLYRKLKIDWQGVKSEYLTVQHKIPIAYSTEFGKKLYRFDNQYLQTPIHAIHTHWWMDNILEENIDHDFYASLIESLIQQNGWIYNPDVSPTNIRTRMKSEYMMSMAMGVEILNSAGKLPYYKDRLAATLSSQGLTEYLSSEYFRQVALDVMDSSELKPVGVEKIIQSCEAGEGYCDFSITSKVDDYMGTMKRTARDKAIHSPLSSIHAHYLSQGKQNEIEVTNRLKNFKQHLFDHPMDIPSFQMRDVQVPFGTDITPLELVAASYLIQAF